MIDNWDDFFVLNMFVQAVRKSILQLFFITYTAMKMYEFKGKGKGKAVSVQVPSPFQGLPHRKMSTNNIT